MRHASEPILLCADHRMRLQSRVTTDGDGGLVELIEPCRECRRPRFVAKAKAAPKPQSQAENRPSTNGGRPVGTTLGANADRDAEMRRRKAEGESAPSLAAAFGMTTQRVYQICRGIRRG